MRPIAMLIFILPAVLGACSQGNYPEAGDCGANHPFFAVCIHGDHGVNGWSGTCRAERAQALQDAQSHARDFHGDNSRWTGVSDVSKAELLVR